MPAAAGPIQFTFNVNTSPVNATAGFIEFQFNPGIDSQAANAVIGNLAGFTLTGVPQLSGEAVVAADAIQLDNGTPYNDFFQGLTHGPSISFVLTLSGPAIDSPKGLRHRAPRSRSFCTTATRTRF